MVAEGETGRVYQEFWLPKPSWESVVQVLKSFLNESTLGQLDQMQIIWILYALVLGLGLWSFRKIISPFLFLVTLFVVLLLGELLVSIRRPIFLNRTLIWTTIPLFLILAAGVAQLRFRFLIIAAVRILSTINLFFVGDYYRFMQKEDWSTAAGYVANFAEQDDLVLFNTPKAQVPFDYYFEAYEDLYLIQAEKQGVPKDMSDSDILGQKMTQSDISSLISLIGEHDRVWLVYSHNWYTDPLGLIPQTLALQKTLSQERNFYGGQIQLYETP